MKLLLVEDALELHVQLKSDLEPIGISVTTAENAEQAVALVDGGGFDLYLCDLNIPASSDAPVPHKQHGLRVFDHMRLKAPGVPVIIFTAYGDLADLRDRLSEAPSENLYGDGPRNLVIERTKDEIRQVIEIIVEQSALLTGLTNDIELSGTVARAAMGDLDQRLIRIHARLHDAVTARMDLLKGGRSAARVLRVRTNSLDGSLASRAVAKLNTLPEVEDELKRYERHVPMLGAGAYANHVGTLRAGAQHRAALLYGLADGYDESLFDLVRTDVSAAVRVLGTLRTNLEPWHRQPTPAAQTVGDVRRLLVPDARLGSLPDTVDLPDVELESGVVYVNLASSHGDLHGGNVLVNGDGLPMLIDFGRVGTATNAIDPITLELSIVFHPDAKIELGGWPTTAQAENWTDLSAYVEGCPIAAYITACRNWANSVNRGDRELDAIVYGYALRQLRFAETPHELAAAYASGAASRLRS
jgi:CheY-like chemotaxis protein